jgi:hypothetical protein
MLKTLITRRAAGVFVLFAGASAARADLAAFQNAVTGAGAPPTATRFATVSGSAPEAFDVGQLSGDRSFEFIANAGVGGPSSALLGTRVGVNGVQGLKFEQYLDTFVMGMTDFGVADYNGITPSPVGADTHIVFASDGIATTDLYVNGVYRETFPTPLKLLGVQGLAAAANADGTYFDVMDGSVLSFASYDTKLTPQEIATHAAAFAAPVPEPATVGLLTLGGVGLLVRRGRRAGK